MRKALVIISGFLALTIFVGVAYEAFFWHRIFPNVFVANINLGTLPIEAAQQKLATEFQTKPINLTWGTSSWTISPDQIELEYDALQSARSAYLVGRQGPIWETLITKITLLSKSTTTDPVFFWSQNQLIAATSSISAQINIPARDPEVQLVNGEVVVLAGENGQAVDERELGHRIKLAVAKQSSQPIEVPVVQINPKLNEDQVAEMQKRAQLLVGKSLSTYLDGQRGTISDEQILSWLDGNGWSQSEIETWAVQIANEIDRQPQNALFNYVGSGRVEEFQPAEDGLAVNQSDLVSMTIAALTSLEGTETAEVKIPVVRTEPAISTSQVNDLGIVELIGRGESDFSGSIVNRIFNLKKAAQNMNGLLIAPGETFSFNQHVGDISTQGGYKQAYIIQSGKTILGDGGGVCQASTTMFRAALHSGLPIVERTAHAYRVHYYEQDSGPGLDATIFTPNVDLKFKNDTPGHILIQTSIDEVNKKLAFEFYGTKDGRVATIAKPKVWDVTAPPPDLYSDDPTLAPGVVKQIDWKAWGAKASFNYKVVRGEEVLQDRTFYSSYRPWQAVYLRGPVL